MRNGVIAMLLAGLACAACADGTIVFIDDDGDTPDTVEVAGNIRDVNPGVAGAQIVVFVFTGLSDDPPGTFESYEKLRSVAVASDADPMDFTITQVESGALTIVFLQDKVSEPDSTIDAGDPFATLDDPDGILDSVKKGENIRVTDVDIDFNEFIDGDPTKGGTAEAEDIRSVPRTDEEE